MTEQVAELQTLCDARNRTFNSSDDINGADGSIVLQLIEQIKVVEMEVETERQEKEQLIVTQDAELVAARADIAGLEAERSAIAAKNQAMQNEAKESAQMLKMASDLADEYDQEMQQMIAHASGLVAELAGGSASDARDNELPRSWSDLLLTLKHMALGARSAHGTPGDDSAPEVTATDVGQAVDVQAAAHAQPSHRSIAEVHKELEQSGQSGTFSLTSNVANGDSRAVDPAYTEIQRAASERGISFDDARLLHAQQKNLEAGEYIHLRTRALSRDKAATGG